MSRKKRNLDDSSIEDTKNKKTKTQTLHISDLSGGTMETTSVNVASAPVNQFIYFMDEIRQARPRFFDMKPYCGEELSSRAQNAVVDYEKNHKKVGFNESLQRKIKWLKCLSLDIVSQHMDGFLQYVLDILNQKETSPFSMKATNISNSRVFPAKNIFFLYAAAQKYKCCIYLFSTRKSPVVISPYASWCSSVYSIQADSKPLPVIPILSHRDSFLGKTTYYGLQLVIGLVPTANSFKKSDIETSRFVASKISQDNKKMRAKPFSWTPAKRKAVETKMWKFVKEECYENFKWRWRTYVQKTRPQEVGDGVIDDFILVLKEQLKKSLPSKTIPKVKERLEKEFEEHPSYANWVANLWKQYSDTNNIHIHQIIDDYKEVVAALSQDTTIFLHEDDAIEVTPIEDDNQEQRMISRTLHAVLKKELDYEDVLRTLTEEQRACTRCIVALCKIIDILIQMILNGEICRLLSDDPNIPIKRFSIGSLGLGKYNLDVENDMLAKLDGSQTDAILKEDLFSCQNLGGFLSNCINKNNVEKIKNKSNIAERPRHRLYQAIIEQLSDEDFFVFTTTPSLQYAIQQLSVNMKNMYNYDAMKNDLRTLLSTLLQLHLRPGQFFYKFNEMMVQEGEPVGSMKKNDQSTGGESVDEKRDRSMTRRQYKDAIRKNLRDLEKIVSRTCPNLKMMRIAVQNTFTPRSEPYFSAKTKKKSEHNRKAPVKITGDVSASHLKALVSVSSMLILSPSVHGHVSAEYIQKQVHKDKRDDISNSAYDATAALVNLLRPLCLRKDVTLISASNGAVTRCIRNKVTEFARKMGNFARKTVKLSVSKDQPEKDISIKLDARTMYLLFSKSYNLYNSGGEVITSVHQITDPSIKEAVFTNYFRMAYLNRLFLEQKLTFCHYIIFHNQYDIKFGGKLSVPRKKQIKSREIPQERETERPVSMKEGLDENTVDDLVAKIKQGKTDLDKLKSLLNKIEEEKRPLKEMLNAMKKEKVHDKHKIAQFKIHQREFNDVWSKILRLSQEIKHNRHIVYCLSKGIPVSAAPIKINSEWREKIKENNVVISGLDPGIISTAVITSSPAAPLVKKIQSHVNSTETGDHMFQSSFTMTPRNIRSLNMSKTHSLALEKTMKKDGKLNQKSLQRRAITRNIRTKKATQKLYSSYRKQVAFKGGPVLTMIGNWKRSGGMKGTIRGSNKQLYQRLQAVCQDDHMPINEYNTTISCSSCFEPTMKQKIIRNGKLVKINGAVVCYNVNCKRRQKENRTTINRDKNGAFNIMISGLSSLMSLDGLPLPAFRKYHKSNSFTLYPTFTPAQVPNKEIEGVPILGDLL